jgi:mannose-6-phosphate isomerase
MLYPFKFVPRFLEKIWGGRKLETFLGKQLPAGKQIGESWELYDFPPGAVEGETGWVSAQIASGPLKGRTLHDVIVKYGRDVHGDVPLLPQGQFPILTKFLDAREDLSVQVHPDEKYAATHPAAFLKNEAWYIMQADEGSRLLRGLKPGVSRDEFEKSLTNGNVESMIHAIPARPGQCFYLKSGTVHALGAGVVVAEVQTASDTTYRVYDFNRVDQTTGKPRKLHVNEALECINFAAEPDREQQRSHVAGLFTTVSRLVTCPQFVLEKVRMTEGVEEPVPYDEPVVWIMLDGQAQVRVANVKEPTTFTRGDTVLLPAAMDNPIIKTLSDCVWLEVTFPTKPEVG